MRLALLMFAMVAACGDHHDASPGTSPAAPPSNVAPAVTAKRSHVTKRGEIPPALQPAVPQHGLYAAGGGLMSSPWRVVVDSDAKTIYGGMSKQAGASSIGKLDKEATRTLAAGEQAKLVALGNDAWGETPPDKLSDPIADYDELLIVADGDDLFYLEGYGPIRRPIAAQAIAALRTAAGL